MKIQTYYKIFYKHRVLKANFILKLYLLITIPIRYLMNIPFMEKEVNLDDLAIKKSFLFDKDLDYLFEHFNSDKGKRFINQYAQPMKRKSSIQIKGHDYAKFYENYFQIFKEKNISIMEIGSFYGNAAAALYFYLKKAKIYSADIFPDLFKYKSDRIRNFFVDSSSEESIQRSILSLNCQFEIIIEDASHSYKDQIISLFMLFPIIKSGGVFITEELDFPDTRIDMNINKEKPTLRDILHKIKSGEDFESKLVSNEQKNYLIKNIDTISIFKGNSNEIAIITKK